MYDVIFQCSILLHPSWTVFSSPHCLLLMTVTTTTIHVNRTVWSLEKGHAERQCEGATMFSIRIVWTLLEQRSRFLWHCSETHRWENASLKMLYLPESQMLSSYMSILILAYTRSSLNYTPPPDQRFVQFNLIKTETTKFSHLLWWHTMTFNKHYPNKLITFKRTVSIPKYLLFNLGTELTNSELSRPGETTAKECIGHARFKPVMHYFPYPWSTLA